MRELLIIFFKKELFRWVAFEGILMRELVLCFSPNEFFLREIK